MLLRRLQVAQILSRQARAFHYNRVLALTPNTASVPKYDHFEPLRKQKKESKTANLPLTRRGQKGQSKKLQQSKKHSKPQFGRQQGGSKEVSLPADHDLVIFYNSTILPVLKGTNWPNSKELLPDKPSGVYARYVAYPHEVNVTSDGVSIAMNVEGVGSINAHVDFVRNTATTKELAYLALFKQLESSHSFADFIYGGKYFNWETYHKLVTNMKLQSDGKLHVLTVALRHGSLPRFAVSSKAGKFTVTIDWPQLNISGSGTDPSHRRAEILACAMLKARYEHYVKYETRGDKVYLNDMTELSPPTATLFLEYVVQKRTGNSKAKPVYKTSKQNSFFSCEVLIQDESMGKIDGMHSSAHASAGAALVATYVISKKNPELWEEFIELLRRGRGTLLKPLNPIYLRLDYNLIATLRTTLATMRDYVGALPEQEPAMSRSVRNRAPAALPDSALEHANEILKLEFEEYKTSPDTASMRAIRDELPVNQRKQEVIELVNGHDVMVIVGATGSGKSTQVPQIILDDMIERGEGASCKIICTQPRRIAAISVAERVANERNQSVGRQVGYNVRFDAKIARGRGTIDYLTIGVLLRRMQNDWQNAFEGVSHVVIDEVHERDTFVDFLLVLLRRLLLLKTQNPSFHVPKIILMSATVDTTLFLDYFKQWKAPLLSIPGRTFPVEEHYLEDVLKMVDYSPSKYDSLLNRYVSAELELAPPRPTTDAVKTESDAVVDWTTPAVFADSGEVVVKRQDNSYVPVPMIASLVLKLLEQTDNGSILVFMPGLSDIQALERQLKSAGSDVFRDRDRCRLYLLHSSLINAQKEVFEHVPDGCRKIIISTNIAETSVTIPELRYVIDSGKERELKFEHGQRVTTLNVDWVSRSNVKQRSGRAGRVQNGTYYALFSKNRFESMQVAPTPEILRTDLQHICLEARALNIADSIPEFLNETIQPPKASAVQHAVKILQFIGALTETGELTPTGSILAHLPLPPSIARMVLFGVLFKCVDPVIIMASMSQGRSIFVRAPGTEDTVTRIRRKFGGDQFSDVMADMNAYREYRRVHLTKGGAAGRQFLDDNLMHHTAVRTLHGTAQQIEELLVLRNVIPHTPSDYRFEGEFGPPEYNSLAVNDSLIRALHFIGYYPNTAVQVSTRKLQTAHDNNAAMQASSLNFPETTGTSRYSGQVKPESMVKYGTIFSFEEKVSADTNQAMLRGTSRVSALPAILFSEHAAVKQLDGGQKVLMIDRWLPLGVGESTFPLFLEMRELLATILRHRFDAMAGNVKLDDRAEETLLQILRAVVHGFEMQDREVDRQQKAMY